MDMMPDMPLSYQMVGWTLVHTHTSDKADAYRYFCADGSDATPLVLIVDRNGRKKTVMSLLEAFDLLSRMIELPHAATA